MPFLGLQHEPYLTFVRTLQLPWTGGHYGDWYAVWYRDAEGRERVELKVWGRRGERFSTRDANIMWVPVAADWLEMLRDEGHNRLVISTEANGWLVYPYTNADDFGSGLTLELALARLWKKLND